MGVNSNFYINNVRPSLNEIVEVFKSEGIEFSNIQATPSKNFNKDGSFDCDYLYYMLFCKDFWVYYFPYNSSFGGIRDGLDEATLHSSTDKKSVDILKRVGAYFGGSIEENDCNEVYEYISKTKGIVLKEDKLKDLIFKNKKMDYNTQIIIYKFIKDNEKTIKDLI
jgi:hypothetical protein